MSRALMRTYEFAGMPVQVTRLNQERPQLYEVRSRDGQVLGYVQRSLTGRVKACMGSTLPDLVGAPWVELGLSMSQAVAYVVQEAASHAETSASPWP